MPVPADMPLPPVVILCGGLGTRLRSAVADRPKVLALIDGVPFLTLLLRHLHRQGVRDVVLSTGYLADQVRHYAELNAPQGITLRCVEEPHPLGTGGALRFAAAEAGLTRSFLALNGDTFFSGSLSALIEAHASAPDALATLALTPVSDPSRYGTVELDADSRHVRAFHEKQSGTSGWVNAGAYVLSPELLARVPPDRAVSLERDLFSLMTGRLVGVMFPHASFLDIGTPDDYQRAASVLRAFT